MNTNLKDASLLIELASLVLPEDEVTLSVAHKLIIGSIQKLCSYNRVLMSLEKGDLTKPNMVYERG